MDGDLSSVIFPDGESLNPTISITGTFHVNSDLVIFYGTIYMEPGSQIIVSPGVIFNLSATTVQACTEMWKGIYLEPTATIWLTPEPNPPYGTHILDAENAVTANDGCTVFMNEAYFQNNRVCVFVPPASPNWNDVTVFSKECTFQSNGPLVPPYPGQTTALGLHGYAAFDVNDMAWSVTGWYTLINSYSNGIVANRSHVTIDGFVMADIVPDAAYPHYANGSGIRAFGYPGFYELRQTGYGAGPNDFEFCKYGIYAEYMSVRSSANHMYSMGTAYRVDRCAYQTIDIFNNGLDTYWNAIDLRFNDGCVSMLVENNNIVFGSSPTTPTKGHTAIYVAEANSANLNSVIRDNSIQFRPGASSARWGIRLSSASDFQVLSNNLIMANNNVNYAGILSSGCRKPLISCNNVQGSFTNYGGNLGQSAIRNNMGDRPRIYCNTVDGTTNGIYFSGAAYGTDLSGNNIKNHKWGLHLDNSAIIEQQYFKGNLWYNTAQPGGTCAIYDNAVNALNYIFRVSPTISIPGSDPLPPTVSPSGWFVSSGGSNFLCEGPHNYSYCAQYEREQCEGCKTELDERIADDDLENEPYTEETKWRLKGDLYEKIVDHPELVVDDQQLAEFYAEMQNTTVAEFKTIGDDYVDLFKVNEYASESLSQSKAQVESLLNQLGTNTAQLGDETLSVPARTAILNTAHVIQQSIGALTLLNNQSVEQTTYSRGQNALLLKTANTLIGVSESTEENEKQVNDTYLSTITGREQFFGCSSHCAI
ncbi:MAG: hypothetical protein IPP33_17275 [Flavobacteriales bacterium]|nr:hypothetical protein [Flavobacteriales bacterium]